jgi:hypothetical protein
MQRINYLLANRSAITQNERIMKPCSLLIVIIIASLNCANSFAQEKAALQSNATVASLLVGSAGKNVELHLRSGEKMGRQNRAGNGQRRSSFQPYWRGIFRRFH